VAFFWQFRSSRASGQSGRDHHVSATARNRSSRLKPTMALRQVLELRASAPHAWCIIVINVEPLSL
jgi:hypothetical protein